MKKIYPLLLVLLYTAMAAKDSKSIANTLACPTAAISYASSSYCRSVSSAAITLTGTDAFTGGTYSSMSGLLIDSTTGTITPNMSTSGTYTVVYTLPAGGGCPGLSVSTVVTILPQPASVNAIPPQTICSGQAANLIFTNSQPGTNIMWNVVSSGVTGASSGSGVGPITLNDVLLTTGNSPGQVTYYVTPMNGGCTGPTRSIVVNVNPTPAITVNNPSMCTGSSATVTATPGASGSYSYVWTVPPGAVNPGNVMSFSTSVIGTYSVIATNTATTCSSLSASGTVSLRPNGNPLTLICNGSSPTSISFDWNNISGISMYNYTYSINGGPIVSGSHAVPSSITIPTPSCSSVTFTLQPTGSVCVPPQTITCSCTMSTDENTMPKLLLGPNPVSTVLNINNDQLITEVTALNQLGQVVMQKRFDSNEIQLDLSDLKPGLYFITIDSDKKQKTYKIVKN